MTLLNVSDISSNNPKGYGDTGYNKAIDENDAVIIKVTEGLNYVNPLCNEQIAYAFSKKKMVGLYHFIVGNLSPVKQAQYFFNNAGNYITQNATMLVLDWEKGSGANYPALTGDEPKQFMDELYRLSGRRAVCYMSTSDYISPNYDWSDITSDYALWIAGYPLNDGTGYTDELQKWADGNNGYFANPKYKSANVAMWQYTSVPYDKSVFYGDANAWDKFTGKPAQQPEPQPTPEPQPQPTPQPDPTPTPQPTPQPEYGIDFPDAKFKVGQSVSLSDNAYAGAWGVHVNNSVKASIGTIIAVTPFVRDKSKYAYLCSMSNGENAPTLWHFLEQDLQLQ